MAITSESQIIDVVTISKGCSIIEDAAKDYAKCSKKVNEAAATCTSKALAVDKQSMQKPLEDLAVGIAKIETDINTFTAQVRSIASQIQAKQMEELAAYRAEQAKQAEAAQN